MLALLPLYLAVCVVAQLKCKPIFIWDIIAALWRVLCAIHRLATWHLADAPCDGGRFLRNAPGELVLDSFLANAALGQFKNSTS